MSITDDGPARLAGRDVTEPSIWALAADASSVDADARAALSDSLAADGELAGRLSLTTCHRVEIYGDGPPSMSIAEHGADGAGPRLLQGDAAVHHLLRVAAGLESAVVGEDQILAQLRMATDELRRDPSRSPVVDRLAQTALAVGRRVRRGGRPTERGLAVRALGWLTSRMGPTSDATILVVGAGAMGRSIAYSARRSGTRVLVATRTPRRLFDGLQAVDLIAGAALAPTVDGVIVALSGRWEAASGLDARGLPPIVDLSSPPALPASLTAALTATGRGHVGIDELFTGPGGPAPSGEAAATFEARAGAEVAAAERAFLVWLAARPAAGAAQRLVVRSARRRQARVERTLRRMPELDERGRELVRQLAAQVAADVLHEPLTHLHEDADGSARQAAAELFDL